jgi:hypothetical protein
MALQHAPLFSEKLASVKNQTILQVYSLATEPEKAESLGK